MKVWHTLLLGRGKQHTIESMIDWCKLNIGHGGWYYLSNDIEECLWVMENNFGHTSISFRNEKDLTYFSLVWS